MTKSICYYTIRVYIILTLTCHVLLLTIFLLRRPYFRPTSLRFQRHHRQQQRNKQGFHVKLYSTDDNPRTFLENLGRSLNYSKDSDWYNINAAVIKQHGGGQLLHAYGDSPAKLLISVFPEKNLLPWKFPATPSGWWDRKENQKQYLTWLRGELKIQNPEDWYNISNALLSKYKGASLLKRYGSLCNALNEVFGSEYKWVPWKFRDVRINWTNKDTQIQYIDWLEQKLSISTPTDWYNVKPSDFRNNYGLTLLMHFGGHVHELLQALRPEYEWLPWKFKYFNVPQGFWRFRENRLRFWQQLYREISGDTDTANMNLDVFYKITKNTVRKSGGTTMLSSLFDDSIYRALQDAFPEHKWLPWKFSQVPLNYWRSFENRISFLKWAEEQLGITEPEGWYNVKYSQLRHMGGLTLLEHAGGLHKLVSLLYPHHNWEPWRFERVPSEWWDSVENQRLFFENLRQKLPVLQQYGMEGWYKVTMEDVIKHGGRSLVDRYNSVRKALKIVYPEHKWEDCNFEPRSPGVAEQLSVSRDKRALKVFVDSLAKKAGVNTLYDWYRVPMRKLGVGNLRIISRLGGLLSVLQRVFPEHHWDPKLFKRSLALERRTTQHIIIKTMQEVLPDSSTRLLTPDVD